MLARIAGRSYFTRIVPLRRNLTTSALMLPHEPTWATVGLFSAGSVALGAIATASIINVLNRRSNRPSEPNAKRQKLSPLSPKQSADKPAGEPSQEQQQYAQQEEVQERQDTQLVIGSDRQTTEDAPHTPDTDGSEPHGLPHPDSVVDLQKLQELEQRVADLNALAELGKVYQDSLALSAQLRNLGSFRLQQDKVLGRGSLAVVQEGEYAGDSVAVKLLPIGSVFAEDSRKEACLALCLHHPNIVRVVGVHLVEVEQKPYLALVQETAPGGDLGWQIEDCDFHTGKRGAASMDVAIKLLLDAARGLAYMHDVDVVHGDVKSRNLLVFWEDEEYEADEGAAAAAAAEAAAEDRAQQAQEAAPSAAANGSKSERERDMVWLLKWCDFGVSFRAADAPDGVLKTVTGTPGFRAPEVMDIGWSKAADTYAFGVIAWQLLTGEKPIVYDREWRMHVPNPNLLRCDRTGGDEEPPRSLVDLVFDCGAYQAKDRPSMREVVDRLEDIAMQRLQKQQAEQAAAAAAKEAEAAAGAAKQSSPQEVPAAGVVEELHTAATEAAAADKATADAGARPPPRTAQAHDAGATCPACQQPRAGFGGLARALSVAAREAAAGGAAADAAAMAHYQNLLQREAAAAAGAAAAAAAGSADGTPPASSTPTGSFSVPARHHTYEVLIQNDDDPITAEAVAHTLNQFESVSASKVLAGHPHALQQLHELQEQHGGAAAGTVPVRNGSGAFLRHCATAPVHSNLLDTAADVAAAAVAAEATGAAALLAPLATSTAAAGRAESAPAGRAGVRQASGLPGSPISIVGAVSRSNIELLPAQGPGLTRRSAGSTAASDAAAGSPASGSIPPAAATGSATGSGWYLASGSSFKKGVWLEKGPAMPTAGGTASAQPQGAANGQEIHSTGGSSFAAAAGVPLSPLSPPDGQALPDAAAVLPGAFSLQIRREHNALPAVAEDDQEDATAAAGQQKTMIPAVGSLPAGLDAGRAQQSGAAAAGAPADAAAARQLRRQQTTRRLGTDVLAAAGALSKALSAFSSASQALPAAAMGGAATPPADGTVPPPGAGAGTNLLLTPDFVAAARGLSEALAALLPSAAALADVAPDQGAAAAAAASEAVAGLKTLQGQMAAAAAAQARGAPGSRRDSGAGAAPAGSGVTGDVRESAFAACASGSAGPGSAGDGVVAGMAAAQAIDIPAAPGARGASAYSIWGTEGMSADKDDTMLEHARDVSGSGGNNSFSFGGLYGSASYGGNVISRRHSIDGSRPSFVAGAAAWGDTAAAGALDSPVLLRMPSRRNSLELRR